MDTHPILTRDACEAIARRNAEILARVDRDVSAAAKALLAYVLAPLCLALLLHFGSWCGSLSLCMAVVGFPRALKEPEAEAAVLSQMQSTVVDAVAGARAAGELDGERLGFIQGTRYGACIGFCYGFLAGAVAIIACVMAGLHKGYGL